MTSNEAESVTASDEGMQQIPAVIQVAPVPAAAEARDALLAAIGAEARQVADQFPGQASAALEELARAYALVAGTSATATPVLGARANQLLTLPLSTQGTVTLLRAE